MRRWWLVGAGALLWGCSEDPQSKPDADTTAVAPDVDDVDVEVEADTEVEVEVDARPGPGAFVVGEADLPDEFVFKGVWAGEAGRIVAVGNDGVVATQSPDGAWRVLHRAEGAELLNAVHGVDGGHLWAVGKDGAILPGTVDSFGQGKRCERDADCKSGDVCTVDTCVDQVCVAAPTGAAGCCGTTFGPWDFEGGELAPWEDVAAEQVGGFGWSVVARPSRAVSGSYALWFGDPALATYGGGIRLAATAQSPSVRLPETGTATLNFNVFLAAEVDPSYDVLAVEVESEGVRTEVWHKRNLVTVPTPTFIAVEADLTPWRGRDLRVRVRFDSVDGTINDFEGPYLDDVRITTDCAAGAGVARGPTLWGVHALAPDLAFAVGRGGALMQFNGAGWSRAVGSDQAAVWHGMTGFGTTVALVGNNGRAQVSRGAGLEVVETDTANTLHDVHTPDGGRFFAVGAQGTVLVGDGLDWRLEPVGVSADLYGVHGLGDDAYAVGDGGSVLHWDGERWSALLSPTTRDLRAVWVMAGEVIAVGQDGVVVQGDASRGFTEVATLSPGVELAAVWASADGAFAVAVGANGRIFARVDGRWEAMLSDTSQALEAVFGTGPNEVWAVGRAGLALRWDGAVWSRVPSSVTALLSALWGDASDRFYAAGSGGTLVAWDGSEWSSVASSTTENLRAVYARASDDVWAVGAAGTIMRFNGLGWGAAPIQGEVDADGAETPMTDELLAVWAHSASEAWAVGENGRIMRWDGAVWTSVPTAWRTALRGVYGLAEDDVWAVGTAGHILHFDGEAWSKVENASIATLYAIHGDGVGHVIAVGDLGTVLRLER